MKIKRKRGGQPGNKNARKHGYYSKIFNEAERADYLSAGDVQGIDEEIALMRHVIKTTASFKDEKHLLILVRAANALNKLVRTRQKIHSGRYDGLKDAIDNVVRDVLVPLGINIENPHLLKPSSIDNDSNNGKNEAGLP